MTDLHLRIKDPEISQWIEKKGNKSKLTREALQEKYQRELQKKYDKQTKKPELIRVG